MCRTAYGREASYSYDAKRFSTPQGKAFDQLEREQLLQVIRRLGRPSRVLEVGCGTGRFLRIAAAEGGHTVWGIDPSPFMLTLTREKPLDRERIRLARAEGAFLPFSDSSFDLVYAIRVLSKPATRSYALEMIKETVRISRHWILLEFVNESRLFRKSRRGTQLTLKDIRDVLALFPSVRLVDVSGILFFSQTALYMVPRLCLGMFIRVDRGLSKWLPHLCSRVYVTLEKVSDGSTSSLSAH